MKRWRALLTVLGLAFLLAGSPRSMAADFEWKVGLASAKITPQKPVYLAGYASRNHPFERVETDLFVKALALEDQNGYRAVLVTADIIGFTADVSQEVWKRVEKATGLKPYQVLFNASHTHTGPALSLDPTPRARDMTEEQARDTVEYTRWLVDRTAETVAEACRRLQPARLSYGVGVDFHVMNRREYTPRGVVLGVNPRGLADRSVPVLRVDGADGKLLAVVFGVACHNTTLTGRHYFVCGDFAGYAQAEIQSRLPGVQAMFVQNCGGSANPYPRGTLEASQEHGHELAEEVCRVLQSKLSPVTGPLKTVMEDVTLPLQPAPPREELEKQAKQGRGAHRWVAQQMLKVLDEKGRLPTTYTTPVAVWQFGDSLTLVGLPMEVVVDYVPLLEDTLGPLNLWIAAYCNDVSGYIPSRKTLKEGGYETRGLYARSIGLFAPETEDVLTAHVRRLAEAAGRQLPQP